MPDDVQIVFAPSNIVQIKFRHRYPFHSAEWRCQHLTKRRNDHTATTDYYCCGRVTLNGMKIDRAVRAPQKLTCAQNKTAAFDCDVSHREFPDVAVIDCRRTPQCYAFRIHCGSEQRH